MAISSIGNLATVLPAPAESAAPVVVDFESQALTLRRQTVDVQRDLTARQRAAKNERVLFCRQVWMLRRDQRLPEKEAVAIVAARAEQFPLLVKGGKGGASALTWFNYRSWMRRLGKHPNGQPNWENQDALADRWCTGVRDRDGAPEFWQLVSQFYLNQNRLSLAESYRLAALAARRAGIAESQFPTQHQVEYWFGNKADPDAVAVARYGEEWARNNLLGYIMRDWSAVRPGEIWYGDHHQFDAPCKVWDAAKGRFAPCRPWLTAWMDAKTHYFVGWVIRAGEHPDSIAIMEALLQGTRANGGRPPVWLATDNGRDYCRQGFVEPVTLDGHEHSVCLELGCRHTTALPYNARAKTIEREFRAVCESFAKWWPGYRGNCPGNRPETAAATWDNPDTLPSLQQFCEAFAFWLQNVYHARAGGESKVTEGAVPAAAWAARPELRPALGDQALHHAFLLPLPATRVVGRGGLLRVGSAWFQSDKLWGHLGERVLVKLDLASFGHVYACRTDGKLLAECKRPDTVPAIAETAEDRAAIGQISAKYRRQLTRARTAVHDMTGGLKVVAPVARLQLVDPAADELPPADSAAADSCPGGRSPAESAPQTDADPDLVRELEALRAGAHDTQAAAPGAAHAQETGDQDQELLAQILAATHEERQA